MQVGPLIVAALFAIAIVLSAYLTLKCTSFPPALVIEPLPIATSTHSVADSTASWKTYVNVEYGFAFKYPPTAELYEGTFVSADGVSVQRRGSVQLSLLEESCGATSGSLLAVVVSDDRNADGFGSPNVFSAHNPDVETRQIRLHGMDALETIGGLPGRVGRDQIGLNKDGMYYVIEGAPCFTHTARQIIDSLNFLE